MFMIIGSTTADLFIFSEQFHKDPGKDCDDGFRAGNLVFCDDPPQMLLGGNGGCSAFVAAGLEMPTALCSAVGQDQFGDRLVSWLEDRNVNLEAMLLSENNGTSASTIIMSDAANQFVYHHLGATRAIIPELIPQNLIMQTEVLLVTSYSLIPALRNGSFNSILSTCHQAGSICALDIGPAIGKPVLLDEIQPLLPHIDFLIANSHELCVLNQTSDWEESCRQLLSAGANCIIVKRGKHGASVRGPETQIDVSGFRIKSRISVGAGDAFDVGVLWGINQGWPLRQSVQFANGVAALIVERANGVLGAPTVAQVNAFLASGPKSGNQAADENR